METDLLTDMPGMLSLFAPYISAAAALQDT